MTELVETAHVGWKCRSRHCKATFLYASTGKLEADRADSRAKAQAEGWLFVAEAGFGGAPPKPGANLSLHYCPACAPIAKARADLRAAERSRRW
jgi:hypothetical protein